mmetsp:Transcript_22315/g.35585  ORF Transcript_22315/g.35585 Transcript_22315/m.35585 type:complete len:446 (+) Transcript_22315:740-2077(+)
MPLLGNPQLGRHGRDVRDEAIHIGLEVATHFGERCQTVCHHGFGPFVTVGDHLQLVRPFVELGVRNALGHIKTTPVHSHNRIALLGRCGNVVKAGHALVRQDRDHADVAIGQKADNFGHVAGHRLGKAAHRLCDRIRATVNADIFDLGDVGKSALFEDHQRFEVVEPTHSRTARKGNRTGVCDDRVNQIAQRLVRAVSGHNDHARIGTNGAHKADLIRRHAGEGVLCQTRGCRRRGRDDQLFVRAALADHGVVGQTTARTGHVGHLHRLINRADIIHDLADLTASKVPAAARVGGCNALCRHGRACAHTQNSAQRKRLEQTIFHGVLPNVSAVSPASVAIEPDKKASYKTKCREVAIQAHAGPFGAGQIGARLHCAIRTRMGWPPHRVHQSSQAMSNLVTRACTCASLSAWGDSPRVIRARRAVSSSSSMALHAASTSLPATTGP